jgi:diguanylate cyclase (GGDEF)-like protein
MLPFADSAVWIAVGLAIAAALVAIATAATLALILARARRRPPPGSASERTSAARTDSMVGRLTGALEDARAESRRSRRLAELASSIDLDDVLTRTLDGAVSLPGIDAAMLALPREDEDPLVATIGMSAEEAAKQPVSTSSGGARAVRISYRYGESEEAKAEGAPIRGGIAVPLRASNETLGTLAVFWRGSDRSAAEEELAELEELAAGCGPAIRNAQRFREARRLADLDALTSLHNRRYFHETLERECVRAERYERRLALILVDVDDFKAINDRLGHLGGDSVLATVSERVRSVVRRADVPCRIGGDEFAVILPESNLADAEHLYRRIQLAVSSRAIPPAGGIDVSAGIAELRPGDDAVSLFQRADDALYRAKRAGKGQVREADLRAPGSG